MPARMMMVGEQPGDREDVEGHVFVGPAGRLLDKALAAAKIARGEVYLTNAVKHFRFTERGKRRIHQQPRRSEVVGPVSKSRSMRESRLRWFLAVRPTGPHTGVVCGPVGRARGRLRPGYREHGLRYRP